MSKSGASDVYLFPDTNVFLHWRSFDEVDWPSVVDRAPVVLVLTRTVVGELDRHKNENKSRKLRERAATALAKIEKLLEGDARVSDRVRLHALSAYARRGAAPAGLDLDRPDDCHVAAVLEFQASENQTVRVVTGDTGMRLAARAHGLIALAPSGERLELEPDEAEAEVRKLRSELVRIQSRLPNLLLRFAEGGSVRAVRLRDVPLEPRHVLEARADRQRSLLRSQNPVNFVQVVDLQQREREIEQLGLLNRKEQRFGVTFRLDVVLQNEGSALADDIHVTLTFPARMTVSEVRPRHSHSGDDHELPARLGPEPERYRIAGDPEWEFNDGVASFQVARLKQQMTVELPALYVLPLDLADRESFAIPVSIIVGSPPCDWVQELSVVIERKAGE